MKYLTAHSSLRVSISGFKNQSDADGAMFSLVRSDNQKKILDQSSTKIRKSSSGKDVNWQLTIDDDIIKDALTDDEMQSKVSVSITAGGKTWIPSGQNYVLYRNKITVIAKDKDGITIAGARCKCTIQVPPDFFSKVEPVPHTVSTKDDGTAEFFLDAPGDLRLEWLFPYYPQDNAAWTSATGAQRDATLLQRKRKAWFISPDVSKGDQQKHYINPGNRKLQIEATIEDGSAGDSIYLTVELGSDGKKETVTLTLADDRGTAGTDIDFKGQAGVTAKLGVSTVEGSCDESVDITSWKQLDVQPYHPVRGFFKNDAFPEPLAKKVKDAFAPSFIDVAFLPSKRLAAEFPGIEEKGKFEIVSMTDKHAEAVGFDAAGRSGEAALVYFKLGKFLVESPLEWIGGADERYAKVYRCDSQTIHAVFAHGAYEPREVRVSLILDGDNPVSAPQSSTAALTASNIDFDEDEKHHGTLILPWKSATPSHWEVMGEETRGHVTMAFVEVDREKMKEGEYEFTLKLPEGATHDPKNLAKEGKKIRLKVNLRGYQFFDTSASCAPLLYFALDPDYTSDEVAQKLVDVLKPVADAIIGGQP